MSKLRVRAIIEHKGKFLLVRLKIADSFWCLPGGGIETGEDIITGLERELVEETGIKPVIGELLFVHQIQTSDGYSLPEFFFRVSNSTDYLNVDLNMTSHGQTEIEEIAFKDAASTRILPGFLTKELPILAENGISTPTQVRLSKLEA